MIGKIKSLLLIMVLAAAMLPAFSSTVYADPEGTPLGSPAPITRPSDLTSCTISWTPVENAYRYEITAENITQGFGGLSKTITVDGSLSSYDMTDVFREISARSGSNTFVISVKALAAEGSGYTDSEPATTPSETGFAWGFQIYKSLDISVDADGRVSWTAYDYPQTKYYYYKILRSGSQVIDGYFDKSVTSLSFDAYAETFNWENGPYHIYVCAMDGMRPSGGHALTSEEKNAYYYYVKKVRTVSIDGVTLPVEGERAKASLNNISVREDHAYTKKDGEAYMYWRRYQGGSWVEIPDTETFAASEKYRISIPVNCDEGYTFANTLTVKINGKEYEAVVETINQTTVRIEVQLDVIAKSESVYVVTAGALNVRSAPGTDSDRLGGLSYGDVIEAKGQSGGWTMIEFKGQTAWVNTAYLALTYSEETAYEDGPVYFTVAAGEMNVREDISTGSARIGGYALGKEVLATGARTDADGNTWIVNDYNDPSEGHKLGYVLFSRVNAEGKTIYYFTETEVPPTKTPAKEDSGSEELVIDTGTYPKVTFVPYKSSVAIGNTAALTDENYDISEDGTLSAVIYPDDARNFSSLTADKIKLPAVFTDKGMVIKSLVLNADGSIKITIGPEDEIKYTITKGADATWTKGSPSGMAYTVNRNLEDDKTFALFKSLEFDGTVLDASLFTASSGSLNAEVRNSYLDTLAAGSHTVRFNFEDGSVSTTLKIADAAEDSSSSGRVGTGDETPVGVYAGILLAALAGLVLIARTKKAEK